MAPDAAASPGIALVPRETFVIAGAGQAGAQAAIALREAGFRGRVLLLGAEPHVPYMRPPLSKKFLGADPDAERLRLRPEAAYASLGIELKLGVGIEAIEPAAAHVRLSNGLRLAYDRLLIATGARARRLEVPGAGGPDIYYVRTLDDARRFRAALAPGRRVTVIGGGFLGLEVAASAASAGARVRVLECEARVAARAVSPEISAFLQELHRAHGVAVRCGARVQGFEGTDRLEAVECDGTRIPTDVAVISVGALPNDELARAAGLACDDGVVVDELCRTSDARIYAAGDCARYPDAFGAGMVRRESVQNACDQGEAAARNMAGARQPYRAVPTYWSQQYEARLQMAGTREGCDEVVQRGDPARGRFARRYLRAGVLRGFEGVNMPGEYMAARRELAAQGEPRQPGAKVA